MHGLKARVIFSDSRQIDKILAHNSVDLILTGPPYWNEVAYTTDQEQLGNFSDYGDFLKEISRVWTGCSNLLKEGGIMAIWVHDLLRKTDGDYKYIPLHSNILETIPPCLILRNIYVWDRYLNKDRGELKTDSLGTRVEYILIFQKKGIHKNEDKIRESLRKIYWQPIWDKKTIPKLLGSNLLFKIAFGLVKYSPFIKLGQILDKVKITTDKYKFSNYITECPEDISDLIVKSFSTEGDTILDPFAGSGTTLKSALKSGRNCIGIELNKDCKQIIEKKLGGRVIYG